MFSEIVPAFLNDVELNSSEFLTEEGGHTDIVLGVISYDSAQKGFNPLLNVGF